MEQTPISPVGPADDATNGATDGIGVATDGEEKWSHLEHDGRHLLHNSSRRSALVSRSSSSAVLALGVLVAMVCLAWVSVSTAE